MSESQQKPDKPKIVKEEEPSTYYDGEDFVERETVKVLCRDEEEARRVGKAVSQEFGTETTVYKARVVQSGRTTDIGINHFRDPDAAKRWLEVFLEERFDHEIDEWRPEQSADEKWSVGLPHDHLDRAVVMGTRVWADADEPISRFREMMAEMEGNDE